MYSFFFILESKFKTFLELLFELNDNDNKFSDVELRDEINTFLVAVNILFINFF